jgi:hypothetical protein
MTFSTVRTEPARALAALLIAGAVIQAGCAHGGANYRSLIDTQGADLSTELASGW